MLRANFFDSLLATLPADRVHVGHRLTSVNQNEQSVTAQFENGFSKISDLLVGADGVHSKTRSLMLGDERPTFTGYIAYRGLIETKALAELALPVKLEVWMGPGKHFVHYFVRGTALLNFVAIVEQPLWARESWSQRASPEDLSSAFRHPQVCAIDAAKKVFSCGACIYTFLFRRGPPVA